MLSDKKNMQRVNCNDGAWTGGPKQTSQRPYAPRASRLHSRLVVAALLRSGALLAALRRLRELRAPLQPNLLLARLRRRERDLGMPLPRLFVSRKSVLSARTLTHDEPRPECPDADGAGVAFSGSADLQNGLLSHDLALKH